MLATIMTALQFATDTRCHATVCRDAGCSLDLSGVPQPYILFSLESEYAGFSAGEARCDYLFVGSNGNGGIWVSPIELTTGRKRAYRFFLQLSAGADFADKHLPPNIVNVQFRPIAVHSRPLHEREYDIIRTCNVPFRNKTWSIKWANCGDKLIDVLTGT